MADPTESDLVYVRMTTSVGAIELELDRARAPVTVKNFLTYVDKGYYHGTIFHRVINGFMIQGGGFDAAMQKKETGAAIANEWKNGLKNFRGTIAMARLGRQPDSATSQFFINVNDNASLDQPRDGAGYAVFGKVVGGMDVVDRIRLVKTQRQAGHGNVPLTPIVIEKTERIDPDDPLQ